MNKSIVDIINFNSDASCLSSKNWMDSLDGGKNSKLCQWLLLFVNNNKKISLGIIGSTLADIKKFNPDAINIINNNKDIFEIILRPWSHDISLYRTDNLFIYNVELGIKSIKKEFESVSNFYLAPEFMHTSRQIELINSLGIEAIFINPDRYHSEVKKRIFPRPHIVYGTSGSSIKCITINGDCTQKYLSSCQLFDPTIWDNFLKNLSNDLIFSWRDGESFLLIPDGLSREECWLEGESNKYYRTQLCSSKIIYEDSSLFNEKFYKSYPINSFKAWIKEMKMMWFIEKTNLIESTFLELSDFQKTILLQLINSDILASAEKASPIIKLLRNEIIEDFTIFRSERSFEGEDYLNLINKKHYNNKNEPHIKKIIARHEYILGLN